MVYVYVGVPVALLKHDSQLVELCHSVSLSHTSLSSCL